MYKVDYSATVTNLILRLDVIEKRLEDVTGPFTLNAVLRDFNNLTQDGSFVGDMLTANASLENYKLLINAQKRFLTAANKAEKTLNKIYGREES